MRLMGKWTPEQKAKFRLTMQRKARLKLKKQAWRANGKILKDLPEEIGLELNEHELYEVVGKAVIDRFVKSRA